MELFLNYNNIENEINDKLKFLKKYNLSDINKIDIDKLAKCVSQIHSYDLHQSNLPLYNSQWVINQITNKDNCKYKNDIICALEMMSKMENYNPSVKLKFDDKKFLTWDMSNSNWHNEYKTGHIGNYVWDIAVILNYVNNPLFSDTFLESYINYSNKKLTLILLYINLYYIQVVEAVMNDNLKIIMPTTKEILNNNTFKTEIISYETLSRLQILGY